LTDAKNRQDHLYLAAPYVELNSVRTPPLKLGKRGPKRPWKHKKSSRL